MKKLLNYLPGPVLVLSLILGVLCLLPMHLMAAENTTEIVSFATPVMQEITIFEKETLEEVHEKLPKVLEAIDEGGKIIEIPVAWECEGDYEGTTYYYYQFVPVIDTEKYDIPKDLEIPYIWLVISEGWNLSRTVTKSENETAIYNFLIDELDCNFATALGILANIERESSFNPKAGASDGYYGICQWGGSRLEDLKNYCAEQEYAYNSLEGQLHFLKHELYGTESRAWSKMQDIEDTAEGAYLAGYNWARYFERCAPVYYEVSAKRARDVYWPDYVTEAPVYRIAGADRYKTGLKIADQLKAVLGVDKFENIVIATGKSFADALSGSYLAYMKNAPILLTNGKNIKGISQYIEKNLKTNGTVYLLGGESAIPKEFEMQLTGCTVKRLSGKTRYETNLEILKEAGGNSAELLVCTGKKFADSLSASAAGKPILLVSNVLNDMQREYLDSLDIKKIHIIGGDSAVSTNMETELEAYGSINRIAGETRYETSVLAAETFATDAKSAVLTYSKNFPDGLCGGPLAAALKAPLILTMTGHALAARNYISAEQIESGYVLGGTMLISDEAVRKIYNLKVSDRITVY